MLCYQDTRSTAAASWWQNDQNEIFQLNTLTRLKPLRESLKVIKGCQNLQKAGYTWIIPLIFWILIKCK